MSDSLDFQHVNVKLFLEDGASVDLEQVINVFHAWIQGRKLEDQLVDVADYRHVPSGPGVILVGHHCQYSVDHAEGDWGVLYNRKTAVTETGGDQVAKALEAALDIFRRLAAEEAVAGKIKLDGSRLQFIINDRLLAGNDAETYDRILPALVAGLTKVFGEKDFELERDPESRKRLTVGVKVPGGFSL